LVATYHGPFAIFEAKKNEASCYCHPPKIAAFLRFPIQSLLFALHYTILISVFYLSPGKLNFAPCLGSTLLAYTTCPLFHQLPATMVAKKSLNSEDSYHSTAVKAVKVRGSDFP
jgi:hypothetical protein